jgi:hypothetical protein
VALSTSISVNEPVVTISVDIQCEQPMHREYQVLLNPPGLNFDDAIPAKTARAPEPANITRLPSVEPAAQQAPARTDSDTRPARAQKKDVAQRPAKGVQSPPAPARSLLRLSAGNDTAQEIAEMENLALRLSTRLSVTETPGAAENAGASPQPDAAASQNPSSEADERLGALVKKIDALEAETYRLNGLLQKNRQALQETKTQEKYMQGWLVALAVFCVACLGMLAWFARRMHQLRQSDRTRWDEWYASNSTDAEMEMDPLAEEAETEIVDEDVEVALRHAEKGVPPSATASLNEQEKAPNSSNIIDWPAASHTSPPASVKKLSTEKFVDEEGGHFHRKPTGLETKEVLDVMQQAEFWISLQNSSSAIEILEFHVHNSPDHDKSTLPWLLLFDLYRDCDSSQQYARLQESFAKTFGQPPPPWNEESADGPRDSPASQARNLPS